MNHTEKWLRYAADPKRAKHPPHDFAEVLKITGKPTEIIRDAWRCFQKKGRIPTMEEINEHTSMRKKRNVDNTRPVPEVGCVASHFLDSGAFTLWTKATKYAEENRCGLYDYYDTNEFYEYMDAYAAFVRRYSYGIDLCANIDAIPNPDISYRNLKYLEKKGIRPVPVVHFGTDLKWLEKHIAEGYDLIGLGGLVGSTSQDGCRAWIDQCFDLVCDTPDRLPKVKLHGFGVATYSLFYLYPWYSCDSTNWLKVGAFGGILVPHLRGGKFIFDEEPYLVKTSSDSPDRRQLGKHYLTLSPLEQEIVDRWLKFIDIPFGEDAEDGTVIEEGVLNFHGVRKQANILFFEHMRRSLPKYPWPFKSRRRKGFGII